MTGLGDRVSSLVQATFRSWWFFIGFLLWTVMWWLFLGHKLFHDAYPWVAWATITTFVTQIDVLVVGIGQKKQQERDSRTLRAILTLAESDQAKMEAILAIGDAQQALLRSTKTELEELQELIQSAAQRMVAEAAAAEKLSVGEQWVDASAKLREQMHETPKC